MQYYSNETWCLCYGDGFFSGAQILEKKKNLLQNALNQNSMFYYIKSHRKDNAGLASQNVWMSLSAPHSEPQ